MQETPTSVRAGRRNLGPVLLLFTVVLPLLCLGACTLPTKPKADALLVLVTGHTLGFLENCGCSGGQSGGMARRSEYLRLAREDAARGKAGPPAGDMVISDSQGQRTVKARPEQRLRVSGEPTDDNAVNSSEAPSERIETFLLDAGNFTQHDEKLRSLESAGVVQAMGLMEYDAVGLGANELELEQPRLLEMLARAALPYTAANLDIKAPAKGPDMSLELRKLVKPYVVSVRPSGLRVGVIHVVDTNAIYVKGREEQGFYLSDPLEAARKVLQANRRKAQVWIISVNTMRFSKLDPAAFAGLGANAVCGFDLQAIAREQRHNSRKLPGQQFGTSDSGAAQRPATGAGEAEPESPGGSPQIGRPLEKGKDILAVRLPLKRGTPLEREAWHIYVRADGIVPDGRILAISDALQPMREEYELENARLAMSLHESGREHPYYVGHGTCSTCHQGIADFLAKSGHMHAYGTLKERGKEHTSCARCHNAGYNKPGGWNAIEDKANEEWDLRNVQCESCHGPGEYHVLIQQGEPAPADMLSRGRGDSGLLPANAATCSACHDHENSPRFSFQTYWPKIAHDAEGSVNPTESSSAKH